MDKSKKFDPSILKKLYIPSESSHKGMNGKLTIIGGSHLFHGASLWALKVASRIVDMVFYSSVDENNALTEKLKGDLYDFIAVPRDKVEDYVEESDVVLIGPGMVRTSAEIRNSKFEIRNLDEVNKIEDEGLQTFVLTRYLLSKYRNKKWVIDAGSLQMMEPEWLRWLNGNVIITPHHKEFQELFNVTRNTANGTRRENVSRVTSGVSRVAKEYNCIILLKGPTDIVCSPLQCVAIEGGNEGMTKGGTGDVLAGLVAALACKNDLFLAASCGSYINKKAGDALYKRVGPYFNASDLADEIPRVMKELLNY